MYFEVDLGVARIRASGGPIEPLYNFFKHKESGAEWPVLLPGAKGLLFRTRRPNQPVADFQIVAMPLPKGEPHPLMRGVYARYSPTGHLLVVTADGKLVAAPFDLKKLSLSGPPMGHSTESESRSAGSQPTSLCRITVRWSTPPAVPCGAGSPFG